MNSLSAAPVLTARPTTYKGIRMRSRLEARFAAFLDRTGFSWEYEPRAFASERGQYLPDFLIRSVGTLGDTYVEVKGARPPAPSWPNVERMQIILASEQASLVHLIAQDVERDITNWAWIGPTGWPHWTHGGLAICGCGQVRFFAPRCDWLPVHRLAGLSDEELFEPIPFCYCNAPVPIRGYLNPFR